MYMAVRNAEAVWLGGLRDGQGNIELGSGAFEGRYSFPSRFEDGKGTNPEELIGGAHAGCFSMPWQRDWAVPVSRPNASPPLHRCISNRVAAALP
jgi:hypothetical protein